MTGLFSYPKRKLRKLIGQGEYEQAISFGNELEAKFSKDPDFLFIMGSMYYMLNDEEKTLHYINRVLEINPYDVETLSLKLRVHQFLKEIDVVMNDGIQKMAEATAGKIFQIGVFINQKSEYTMAKPGIIDVHVKSVGRNGWKTKLGYHHQSERFRIESTGKVFFAQSSPVLQAPKKNKRNARLFITFRPAEKISKEIKIISSKMNNDLAT